MNLPESRYTIQYPLVMTIIADRKITSTINRKIHYWLVVSTPSEKYESVGMIIPNILKNESHFPVTSQQDYLYGYVLASKLLTSPECMCC